ncbi:MAG: CHAT domain-containing protein [Candidatus Helarchaeota archaeon]|nr:CHAT domain-containing protein [Candidatus Helarchaeota archaeon]
MGSPDEEKEEKKEDEEEEEVELVAEGLDSIRQEVLSAPIELNVAPPMDIGEKEYPQMVQSAVPSDLDDIAVQMAIPTEGMVAAPPPSEEPPKPRDKVLVKADDLIAKARQLTREYKYEAALQQITKRINLLKAKSYKYEYAQTLLFGGHVLNIIQKSDEAKALLEDGIEVLKGTTHEDSNITANLKVELGIADQKLGDFEQALEDFTQAGEIFKNNRAHSEYIRTLWNKGITYYNLQDWKSAVELYLEIARESAKRSTAMTSRLRSLQKISELIQMVGKRSEGKFDSKKYFEEMDKLKIDYEQALAHEVRRITKGGQLEHEQAEQARDPANLALWNFNLAAAEVTAISGDLNSAINHYNKAIELYKEIGDKLGLSRCYQHLAFIKEKQGQDEEALSLLRQCIELREDLKETLKTEEYRTAIQAEIIPIYDELSYLEAKRKNYEASLNAIEQSKSRELINYLANESLDACPYVSDLLEEEEKALGKLRDLEADLFHFRMRYSQDVRRGNTPTVEDKEKLEQAISELHTELQEYRRNIWMKCIDSGNTKPPIQYDILSKVLEIFKQEKNWAILEFIWNPNRAQVMVYLISPSGMKLFQTKLTSKELNSLLKRYKTALIDQNEKELRKSAQIFSEKIIPAEVHAELEKAEKIQYLFVIPHKELHSIPFEIINHKNKFWGQKYAIVKNFSLDLSRITLQKRLEFLKKNPKMKNTAIIVGNPTMDLINAEVEAKEVEHMLTQKGFKAKLLLKKKSKEDVFVKSTNEQNIIHFAGHGVFITPEPILSHLQFATSALTAREITQLKLKNIPIVVLSACETAIPGFLGGNELVGFVRSFILAGSTTLVSTNWPVSDISARELIEKFYEFLLMGASVGISLQKARQFIAQKYKNKIIHWAAYTLFGDPFRKLL